MANGTYTLLTELATIKQIIDNVLEYNWSVKSAMFFAAMPYDQYIYYTHITNSLIDIAYPIHF